MVLHMRRVINELRTESHAKDLEIEALRQTLAQEQADKRDGKARDDDVAKLRLQLMECQKVCDDQKEEIANLNKEKKNMAEKIKSLK